MAEAGKNHFDRLQKAFSEQRLEFSGVPRSAVAGLDIVFLLKRPTHLRQTPVFNLQWHRAPATVQFSH